MVLLSIFLGGGIGAILRHIISSFVIKQTGTGFPWGILAVNMLGSFLIGLVIEASALKVNVSQELRFFLVTGFLGGFTTFSAFTLETVLLYERHDYVSMAAYVILSVVGCFGATMSALWIVRHFI